MAVVMKLPGKIGIDLDFLQNNTWFQNDTLLFKMLLIQTASK